MCNKTSQQGSPFTVLYLFMGIFKVLQIFLHFLYSTPPAEALKEILFNIPRVSFYGFLMAMAKSEHINEHIGEDCIFYFCYIFCWLKLNNCLVHLT